MTIKEMIETLEEYNDKSLEVFYLRTDGTCSPIWDMTVADIGGALGLVIYAD